MEVLKEIMLDTFKLPCHNPANFQKLVLKNLDPYLPLLISPKTITNGPSDKDLDHYVFTGLQRQYFKGCAFSADGFEEIKVMDIDETIIELNSLLKIIKNDNVDRIVPHKIEYGHCFRVNSKYLWTLSNNAKGNREKMIQLLINDIKLKMNEKIKRYIMTYLSKF